MLQLLRLLRQHEPKSFLFVFKQFIFTSDQVILRALEAPPWYILWLIKLFLSLNQVSLFFDKVLFDLLSQLL